MSCLEALGTLLVLVWWAAPVERAELALWWRCTPEEFVVDVARKEGDGVEAPLGAVAVS